jgi:hypothetical protein
MACADAILNCPGDPTYMWSPALGPDMIKRECEVFLASGKMRTPSCVSFCEFSTDAKATPSEDEQFKDLRLPCLLNFIYIYMTQ